MLVILVMYIEMLIIDMNFGECSGDILLKKENEKGAWEEGE